MSEKYILIVDDDKTFAQDMASLLSARNYKVNMAHNGADAMELIHQHPDLILLDRKLPDMEGLDICRRIRDDKRLQHISVIIITARNTSAEKVEGFYCGADDYLGKPVDEEELVARMEAVLRRNHAFRQTLEEKGALATELRKILRDELITPYFQPIYSMKTLLPLGLEALSRPPATGLIDNAEFLFKAATILDLYAEVELLCWQAALAGWKRSANQKKLFLNCTPYFIESGRLNEDLFFQMDVNPAHIVLEITERTAIQNYNTFLERLSVLKRLGISIAVDDVGSGFASLDTVVAIRPDIVKIDRELVCELHKDELKYNIMQAVISFCKKSKIMCVAEGIEEPQEMEIVAALGVDAVQGYLLGKPSPDINPEIFTKKFSL